MAKNPFYRVLIKENQQDITDNVTRLSYEDTIEKDDLVTITFDNITNAFIDNNKLNKGTELIFTFGFQGGNISTKKLCIIKDITVDYNKTIKMTIKALDGGLLLKKLTSNRIWTKLKTSDIVKQIASQFKLKSVVDDTDTIHDAIPQANKSFYSFIQELTNREGSLQGDKGSYQFYIKGDVLYFTQRDLSIKSIRKFTYGNGDDIVKSFKPTYQQKKGTSKNVSASGIDLDSNKTWSEKADVSDTKETGIGSNKIVYDVNGNIIDKLTETNSGKSIVPDSTNQSEAKQKITGLQKDAELKELIATLSIEGEPLIESGSIITMAGVAQKFAGNYYITSINHSISRSGYSSDLKLNKNAAIKPPLDDTLSVKVKNNSIGKDTSDVKKEVGIINYDVDGNIIKT